MKQLILFTFLLTSAFIVQASNSTETRTLDKFDEISVASGITALLKKSNTNKVDIDAEGIDIDKVVTEVQGGKLKVKIESSLWNMGWNKSRKVSITIHYTEELEAIKSSSGSSVESDDTIESNSLRLGSSSGSRMDLDIAAESVRIDVSSGASLKVSGTANYATVDVSSGSAFKGYDLIANEARLEASSGANIKITVEEKIIADASSGANISYHGNPSTRDIDKSSGGSVKNN